MKRFSEKNLKDLILAQSFLVLLFIFFVPIISSIFAITSFVTFCLYLLFGDGSKKLLKRFKNNWGKILILSSLYFICLLGLLWTEDVNFFNGLKKAGTQLSLILFPLIYSVLTIKKRDIEKLVRLLFLLLTVLFFSVTSYQYIAFGFSSDDLFLWIAEQIHRTYFSLYIVFLSSSIFYDSAVSASNSGDHKKKITGIVVLGLGILMTQILESRMALVCYVALMIFMMFFRIQRKTKIYLAIVSVTAILLTFFVLMPNSERGRTFLNKYKKVFTRDEFYRPYHFEIRFGIWESSLLVIERNFLYGVGTGDVDNELKQACIENKLPKSLHYTNVHNQYLDTFLRYGFIGFMIWITTIILFIRMALVKKDFNYILFLIVVHIFFLTENILGRQMGVMFYAIFNSMFYFNNYNPKIEKKGKNIKILN